MKNFVAISFCVLGALVFSANGASIVNAPSAFSTTRAPDHGSEFGSAKVCCYIGDIEILLPIVINGTGTLKRKATDMMLDIAERCKSERGTADSIVESPRLTKAYKLVELAEEILENDESMKANSQNKIELDAPMKHSCNTVDFIGLFPKLINGTRDEKAAVFDAMMSSVKHCNAEKRFAGEEHRYCDLDNKEKWGLFFQWMFSHYMNQMFMGMGRIIDKLSGGRMH